MGTGANARPGRSARFAGRLALAWCLLAAGCGRQAPRGEVEGMVRSGGKPLASVLVTFVPEGGGRPRNGAAGRTDAGGRYRLRGQDGQQGAAAGAYRVVVEDLAAADAPRSPDGTLRRKPPVRFPPHYGDLLRTPLRREVGPGAQTIDLDLSGPP